MGCSVTELSTAAEMVLPATERLLQVQYQSNSLKFYGLSYKGGKTYGFGTLRSYGSLIGYCLLDEMYFWKVTAHVLAPNLSQLQGNRT